MIEEILLIPLDPLRIVRHKTAGVFTIQRSMSSVAFKETNSSIVEVPEHRSRE